MKNRTIEITYGLGDYTGVLFDFPDSYSLEKIVKKAVDRGVDYVVKEVRIYNGSIMTYKRVAVGLKIDVLTYEQAQKAFVGQEEILKQLVVHYQQGNKFFIVNDAKTEYAPLSLYNRFFRLDDKKLKELLAA